MFLLWRPLYSSRIPSQPLTLQSELRDDKRWWRRSIPTSTGVHINFPPVLKCMMTDSPWLSCEISLIFVSCKYAPRVRTFLYCVSQLETRVVQVGGFNLNTWHTDCSCRFLRNSTCFTGNYLWHSDSFEKMLRFCTGNAGCTDQMFAQYHLTYGGFSLTLRAV